jgi:hypothetical protein
MRPVDSIDCLIDRLEDEIDFLDPPRSGIFCTPYEESKLSAFKISLRMAKELKASMENQNEID